MSNQHTPDSAVGHRAAWIDKRARGRMRFDGSDAAPFLHALVSNDVEHLAAGAGVYATYLTPQGRMIADLRIYHRGDHLLADVPPGMAAALVDRLDQLIFAEDVRVTDVSAHLSQLSVTGEDAASVVSRAVGVLGPLDTDAGRLAALSVWSQEPAGAVVIARTDDFALPSYDIFVPSDGWDAVVGQLAGAGARALPDAEAVALRIEAGRPAFGVDMTSDTIPLEAGLLDRAISQNKGCYVGQEIIVRVLHRGGGRVAKRLVRLELDPGPSAPPPGAAIFSGDRETGLVTSVAWSPRLERIVALGYVHRDDAEVGRVVQVGAAGARDNARVTGLAG